jgi:hypothetical protein
VFIVLRHKDGKYLRYERDFKGPNVAPFVLTDVVAEAQPFTVTLVEGRMAVEPEECVPTTGVWEPVAATFVLK